MRKLIKWWLLIIPLAALAVFVSWAETPYGPLPEAVRALQTGGEVIVEPGRWLIFKPAWIKPTTGLIFYPGARIAPAAYAPAARAIAVEGYLVVVVPMPLNLAVVAPGSAKQVLEAFPEINRWAIGGHSLGGAMAANFASRNPHQVQGLALWAAYPASSDDLSGQDLLVISIYGTLDGLASTEEIAASRSLLPASTRWVVIEGGNHAQFGWYGDQPGDHPAQTSREDQQEQVVHATVELLQQIDDQEFLWPVSKSTNQRRISSW